jgi:uncharacterized protein YbjT (DUF2867 family)
MKSKAKNRYSIRCILVCLIALMSVVPAIAQHDTNKGLVLVAGATGGTGKATVSALLSNGYRVRAFVRNIDSARDKLGSGVEFAEGDVRERDTIDAAMVDVTAVISSIGAGRGDPSNGPEFVDYGGVKNLVEAAADAGVGQFVLVSSMGVTHEDHALNKMFSNILIWKLKGEDAVRNSGVPYTVVRPGGLIDEPGGETALLFQQGDEGQGQIPRADVARILVAALSLSEARGKTFELISGEGTPSASVPDQFAVLKED